MKLSTRWLSVALALGVALFACVGDDPNTSGGSGDSDAGFDTGADAISSAGDAQVGDTGVVSDGAADAGPACDLTKSFGAPVLLPGVTNTTDDESEFRLTATGSSEHLRGTRRSIRSISRRDRRPPHHSARALYPKSTGPMVVAAQV
jgi:hypothetical protein